MYLVCTPGATDPPRTTFTDITNCYLLTPPCALGQHKNILHVLCNEQKEAAATEKLCGRQGSDGSDMSLWMALQDGALHDDERLKPRRNASVCVALSTCALQIVPPRGISE